MAVHKGCIDCTEQLLESHEIDPNQFSKKISPPLHLACIMGHMEIVKLLCENGANPKQEDSYGRIPLEVTTKQELIDYLPKFIGEIDVTIEIKEAPYPFCKEMMVLMPKFKRDRRVVLYSHPEDGLLQEFESGDDIINNCNPVRQIYLNQIYSVKRVPASFLKFGRQHHLRIQGEDFDQTYYTNSNEVINEWIHHLIQAIDYSQNVKVSNKRPKSPSKTDRPNDSAFARKQFRRRMSSTQSDISTVPEPPRIHTIDDFEVIHEIGKGSFGVVKKVVKKDDRSIFALKCLSISLLQRQKQLNQAVRENKILRELSHPYIITLHSAFQDKKNLYLLLDYCETDLDKLIQLKKTLNEYEAKFYLSEIVLAFEYLHSQNIIYRDLKPSNILIDTSGHVKIADFGLARQNIINNAQLTLAGSPNYLAPEVVSNTGTGKPADIYGIGIVLFEMLAGYPPFQSNSLSNLVTSIRSNKIKFPEHFSKEARNFIQSCMNRQPIKRPTIAQIKKHVFFRKVYWEALGQMKVKPPNKQTVMSISRSNSAMDLSIIYNSTDASFIYFEED